MKHLIALICLLSLTTLNAQDTLFFNNDVTSIGEIISIDKGVVEMKKNGYSSNFALSTVVKLSISDSNPNKETLQKNYLAYLDNKIYVKPAHIKSNQPQTPGAPVVRTAGYYLQQGAKLQTGGIVLALGTSIFGGVISAVSKKPTVGLVIVGAGGLTGLILNLGGISDYRKAGEILDRNQQ